MNAIIHIPCVQEHIRVYNFVMSMWKPWQKIWDRLFHESLQIESINGAKLPLSLIKRFQYAYAFYRGNRFLVAMDMDAATPDLYRQYLQQLETLFNLPVVFFLTRIPSYQRSRMIKANVPFMTIDGYAYMPQFYIHLKTWEQHKETEKEPREFLSPVAQVLVLRHILFNDIHDQNLRQIGSRLPYSAMSLSNAKKELVTHGLCRYDGATTRGHFNMNLPDNVLWEKALPLLRSPVQKQLHVRSLPFQKLLPLAGESALSKQTLLVDGNIPTYAVGKQSIRELFLPGDDLDSEHKEAQAIIQQWMYPPEILMHPGGKWVDSLSLYLSLRNSLDDRIIQELHTIPLPCFRK